MNSTSASLLERLRNPHDHVAWARVVQIYTPLLFYWLRRANLQEADAADVVQEVFLALSRKLPELADNSKKGRFRAWLRTVALNKVLDRRKRRVVELPGEKKLLEVGQDKPNEVELFAEEEYQRHLLARALAVMQSEFSATTWQACWQHVVEGRSAPEVAAALGITPGAVYAARFRVIARLRQELAGLLD